MDGFVFGNGIAVEADLAELGEIHRRKARCRNLDDAVVDESKCRAFDEAAFRRTARPDEYADADEGVVADADAQAARCAPDMHLPRIADVLEADAFDQQVAEWVEPES